MRAPSEAPDRLRKRSEFLAVAKGRRFHTERMTLQAVTRPDAEPAPFRVGFTVTKKVGHSPERNRIRRRLRVAVAEACAGLALDSWDVVVVGRRPALAATYSDLVDDLVRGLRVVTRPKTTPAARSAAPTEPPGGGQRPRPAPRP